jgi:DNA invertase Pin-like site-specific DNA recombinase
MENLQADDRNHRLEILAADLAELERRRAQQRIRSVIEEAKRRKLRPRRDDLLKPYQVESALRRIGRGESVLSVSARLRCACTTLYRAIAALGLNARRLN